MTINERYKQVPGFPDYFVTESGDVYSQRLRGNEKIHRLRKLTPKNPGNPLKYYNVNLCRDGEVITFAIHRLVAELFVDGYFDGAVVNHIDGNNRNNHYTNLEWVTQKENIHKSYVTSSVDQTRNYKWWDLFGPEGDLLGTFKGCQAMEKYVADHLPGISPTSLSKYHFCKGYTTVSREKDSALETVTTIPQGST